MYKYSFCEGFNRDVIDQYDDLLNECYEPVQVAGLTFDVSEVIFNCDPIAYRVGLADFESDLIAQQEEEE